MKQSTTKGSLRNTAIYSLLQMREAEQRPIRVGVIGAGATGRAIALQLGTPVAGMRLAAMSNRTPQHAERAFKEAGIARWETADTPNEAAARSNQARLRHPATRARWWQCTQPARL